MCKNARKRAQSSVRMYKSWLRVCNVFMNEWCIYITLYCVLLYTQSTFTITCVCVCVCVGWGGGGDGSLLNHHQCAASTWKMTENSVQVQKWVLFHLLTVESLNHNKCAYKNREGQSKCNFITSYLIPDLKHLILISKIGIAFRFPTLLLNYLILECKKTWMVTMGLCKIFCIH